MATGGGAHDIVVDVSGGRAIERRGLDVETAAPIGSGAACRLCRR